MRAERMTNKDFYAFCRDQRRIEGNEHRRIALHALYRYMWECGVTKAGVARFIEHCIDQAQSEVQIVAYRWLGEMFEKNIKQE
jgi:hypothetical protein